MLKKIQTSGQDPKTILRSHLPCEAFAGCKENQIHAEPRIWTASLDRAGCFAGRPVLCHRVRIGTAMLRIAVRDDERAAGLQIGGQAGARVCSGSGESLERVFRLGAPRTRRRRFVRVSLVDDRGRELLARMHASGAKLVGTEPMTNALIEEIRGDSRRRAPRWMRGVGSLFFLLIVSAVPRKEAVLDFVRGMGPATSRTGCRGGFSPCRAT